MVDTIPFVADAAVELWRDMVEDVERYDFTRFDYEVIGRIFERLIAPDERHKLGQYFTPSHCPAHEGGFQRNGAELI